LKNETCSSDNTCVTLHRQQHLVIVSPSNSSSHERECQRLQNAQTCVSDVSSNRIL